MIATTLAAAALAVGACDDSTSASRQDGAADAPGLPDSTPGAAAPPGADATDGPSDPSADRFSPSLLYDRGTQVPEAIYVAEQYLYWYESNLGDGPRVLRAPKDGSGTPEAVGPTSSGAGRNFIVSDRQYVYWAETDRLVRVSHALDESDVVAFPASLRKPYLLLDKDALYVADLGCFHIYRVSIPDLELQVLRTAETSAVGGVATLAVDRASLYCSTGELGTIVSVPKAGGDLSTVVELEETWMAGSILYLDGNLYVLQVSTSLRVEEQRISRFSLDGGSLETIGSVQEAGAGSNLVPGFAPPALYWLSGYSVSSQVFRYSMQDGRVDTLLEARDLNATIAGDDQRLYWSELVPGGIWTSPL